MEQVLGTDDVTATGPGAVGPDDDSGEGNTCVIRRPQSTQPTLRVGLENVGDETESTVAAVRQQAEESASRDCSAVDDENGQGVICDITRGSFAPGAYLDVVKDDWLIRVRIEGWPDSEPSERASLAKEIAVNAAHNLEEFQHGDAGA
ncbi:hypothetical protein [Aeromicrobium sp. CTD01-1L150]|uniref:hypothetical protein n=1 Tax=Aeromicrobium sp. CTD01-1L150 TaxID=3341830 RepID=UPI0035C03E7E